MLNDFAPRFRLQGSTFERMVETFTEHFGPFDASPIGRTGDFRWSADFQACDGATFVTSHHQGDCYMRATARTIEHLSIVLPRTGGKDVAFGCRTVEARPGEMLLTNTSEPDRITLRGGATALDGLLLDRTIIDQTFASVFEIPLTGSLDLMPVLDLATPDGQLIGRLAETIMEGMRDNGPLLRSPVAMSHLTQALGDLVLRSVPHRFSHLLCKRAAMISPWHIRDAVNFMHANIDRPITMPMVAAAIGVSLRSLETGFNKFKETTPAAYLRCIRLRGARMDLLDPSNRQSVKDICLKWGFFHLGRFSATYKAAYGENPSDTRRRTMGS